MSNWIDITRPMGDSLLCWPGRYERIALPLRMEGAEASPARVLVSVSSQPLSSVLVRRTCLRTAISMRSSTAFEPCSATNSR